MNKEDLKQKINIAKTLDLIIDIFIKGVAIYYIFMGDLFSSCVCFGMSALWGISMVLAHIISKMIQKIL